MGSWIHGMVDKFTSRTDEEAMRPEQKVVGSMEMEIPQELALSLQQALEGGHWMITVWREAGPIVHVFRQTERFSKDRMEEALELLKTDLAKEQGPPEPVELREVVPFDRNGQYRDDGQNERPD